MHFIAMIVAWMKIKYHDSHMLDNLEIYFITYCEENITDYIQRFSDKLVLHELFVLYG